MPIWSFGRLLPAGPVIRRAALALGLAIVAGQTLIGLSTSRAEVSATRRSPIVTAVERARSSIVNIHGEKLVESQDHRPGEAKRRVNGMGTGVFVDPRGYIVTNHHVVDGVKKIMVTTSARETHVARLISHDPKTDLAVIKIDGHHDFDTIPLGTSHDLLAGETVIAVGNAYGYEHTVTRGIISALHRTVQVSDAQSYEDLIQTDASINPGNSGGPLLNVDGEMIGLNVAVRAGAQGIGFAIPSDRVMMIASELLSARRVDKTWHGLQTHSAEPGNVVVRGIDANSPADIVGLQTGDVVRTVDGNLIARSLDIERAILGHRAGDDIELTVERDSKTVTLRMTLANLPRGDKPVVAAAATAPDTAWDTLGLRLEITPAKQFQQFKTHYRGGLTVTDVRPESPAGRQGIRRGDVLVGMHVWETVSTDNVSYILSRPDFAQLDPLKFYILRGNETLYGHLQVQHRGTRETR